MFVKVTCDKFLMSPTVKNFSINNYLPKSSDCIEAVEYVCIFVSQLKNALSNRMQLSIGLKRVFVCVRCLCAVTRCFFRCLLFSVHTFKPYDQKSN